MDEIKNRKEIPTEHTWALEDLYASDDEWKKDLDKIRKMLPEIETYCGKLGESADTLLSFLEQQDELSIFLDRFANYSMRKADEDTKNTTYQGLKDQTTGIYVTLSSALSFAEPEILAISDAALEEFYAQRPKLKTYRRYLEDIRRKKAHILSNAE